MVFERQFGIDGMEDAGVFLYRSHNQLVRKGTQVLQLMAEDLLRTLEPGLTEKGFATWVTNDASMFDPCFTIPPMFEPAPFRGWANQLNDGTTDRETFTKAISPEDEIYVFASC